MKFSYKYLVYLSFVFLIVALHNADYLRVPQIFSAPILLVSFIFLFAGFIINSVYWKEILQKTNCRVSLSECVAGIGLSIFGKYIPGKIWTIVGPAAYVAKKSQYSLGKLSAISLCAQFITLWIGLIFGSIGLFLLGGLRIWGWLILFLWLGLTVVIFSKLVHGSAERLIRTVLRKDIQLPRLTIKSTLSLMPWFVIYWVVLSIGFYMLVVSLTEREVPWSVGLGFSLAGTLGTMALITPGGLGTREGVMVGYLILAGIPVPEATTIAVASRLWFLLGEVFIFTAGWVSDRMSHSALHQTGCEPGASVKHLSGEGGET